MNMHRPDPEARRVAALVEENETLREEVRQLRQLLCPPLRTPHEWGLTLSEERLLSALRAAGPRTLFKERAVVAMCDRDEELPDPKILTTLVYRIRVKLAQAGIADPIRAVVAEGYRLTPEGRAALNAALEPDADPTTPPSRALKRDASAPSPTHRTDAEGSTP